MKTKSIYVPEQDTIKSKVIKTRMNSTMTTKWVMNLIYD